jgi:polysaccharide export outer membrane protein
MDGTIPAQPPLEYTLNPGDSVDISIFDVPELSRTYVIGPDGDIVVPLLPQPVQATGLTPSQLSRVLEDAFRQSGRLQRPEITVVLKQSISGSVAVEGDVKTAQIVTTPGRAKLADVIVQCGGVADESMGATVTITRGPLAMRALSSDKTTDSTYKIDLKKVMDPRDPASEIAVWPGDRVVVEALPPVYYVLGEVKSPGGYTFKYGRDEVTFLRAIALAGDLTNVAKRKKAYIIRKDPATPTGRQELQISLASVLAGKSPDLRVQPEDIIFVPGSNGKKALHLLESTPGIVTATAVDAAVIH